MSFKDKVVLVTGASSGIGAATALLFAQAGARLALTGRSEPRLRAASEAVARAGGLEPLLVAADLAEDGGCERVAAKTLEHYGRLDVLLNNAGVGVRTTIEKTDMAEFDHVFATDVRAVYNLTRLLVPALIESKGNIVNISSVAGTMVSVGALPYSMAKAALDHFTQLVALELAPKGVRVNTISPGLTVTEFHKNLTGSGDEEYQQWLKGATEYIPMGRPCSSEDIGHTILHVASDASALMTGANIPVDGGVRFVSTTGMIKSQIK